MPQLNSVHDHKLSLTIVAISGKETDWLQLKILSRKWMELTITGTKQMRRLVYRNIIVFVISSQDKNLIIQY